MPSPRGCALIVTMVMDVSTRRKHWQQVVGVVTMMAGSGLPLVFKGATLVTKPV